METRENLRPTVRKTEHETRAQSALTVRVVAVEELE